MAAEANTPSPGPFGHPDTLTEYSGHRPACLPFPFTLSRAQLSTYSLLTFGSIPFTLQPSLGPPVHHGSVSLCLL